MLFSRSMALTYMFATVSRLSLSTFLLAVVTVNSGYVCAGDFWQPDYVGTGVSYTADAREGANLEAAWQFNTDWRFKARLEHGSHSSEHNVSLVEFAESFERSSIGLFVERNISAFPALSFSAGIVHFDKASTWVAEPKASAVYQLNGRYYSGLNLGKPEATVSYRELIPYFGVAWSSLEAAKAGWGVKVEAGAMFSLAPTLTIQSNNPSGLALLNADLQHEADAYVERLKANDELLQNVAPRIGVTAIYQF